MGQRSQLTIFLLIQLANLSGWGGLFFFANFPVWLALGIPGAVALLAAWRWHDGYWWLPIHALFLPFALLALRLEIAPLWYLAAFGLSWLVFGHVGRSRVPLYLSNRQALVQLEQLLPQGARLLDIGAGTGTVLAWLVQQRPDLQLCGVELAWLPWLIGRLRLPRSVNWQRADYRTLDFSDFDVTYAFLSPAPMAELWQKACAEMPKNSLFVSNTFSVPEQTPDEIIELGDWKGGKLLLWRM